MRPLLCVPSVCVFPCLPCLPRLALLLSSSPSLPSLSSILGHNDATITVEPPPPQLAPSFFFAIRSPFPPVRSIFFSERDPLPLHPAKREGTTKKYIPSKIVSYADVASKGPKQSPEEAVPKPPPSLETTESLASTGSLIDVDSPSVRTISSADLESSTANMSASSAAAAAETNAERLTKEAERLEAELEKDYSKAKAEVTKEAKAVAKAAKAQAAKAQKAAQAAQEAVTDEAQKADAWVTSQFADLQANHPTATQAAVIGNGVAVVGLGAFLGVRAWGLHEQGKLDWKVAAIGAGVIGAVALVEGTLASYFQKAKPKTA